MQLAVSSTGVVTELREMGGVCVPTRLMLAKPRSFHVIEKPKVEF